MSDNLTCIGQQLRPEWEIKLSDWERAALIQRRNDEQRNQAENPAIWDKLMMVEAKLDQILALLQSKS